jgi:PPM family protein phosphatase
MKSASGKPCSDTRNDARPATETPHVTEPLRAIEIAQATHVGLVRGHNEDRYTASTALLAVADGMGGALAGEVAAGVAVERLEGLAEDVSLDDLAAAVASANDEIRDMALSNTSQSGMGTTLTALLVREGRALLAHVGDSRAYLLRDGELRRLTDDHSLVNELVKRGEISASDAERHPHRNVITRALGAEPTVQIDRVEIDLDEDDVLLLCTDGLTSYVSEDEVLETLLTQKGIQAAADALVQRANAAGGADNVTVVLARMGRADAPEDASGSTATMPAVAGDTAEIPAAAEPAAPARPIRSVRVPDSPRPAPPARVLQRAGGRRSRRGPIAVAIAIVLLLLAGGAAWAASRTYVVEEDADGIVQVAHGFPWSPVGVDLARSWQSTGVRADDVREADADALSDSPRGQGSAVRTAVRLVWAYGLPSIELLTAPAPPPPPAPARPARQPAGA